MKISNIKKRYYTSNSSSRELLYYYISELLRRSTADDKLYENFMSRQQVAGLLFGHGIDGVEYVVKVLDQYGQEFFEFIDTGARRSHFRPNMEELREHHPEIFSNVSDQKENTIKEQISKALSDEINFALKYSRDKWIHIEEIRKVTEHQGKIIYSAKVFSEDDDQVITLSEDMVVKLRYGKTKIHVTVLEFDAKDNTFIFRSSERIIASAAEIEYNCIFLINKLKEEVNSASLSDSPFYPLFHNRIPHIPLDYSGMLISKGLDDSQLSAMTYALNNGISYIWGPPGTGKSHTLSSLLVNLLQTNERTLVCSIANVAVNGLANKFIDRMEECKFIPDIKHLREGDALRIGFIKDKSIIKNNLLFPDSIEINQLRSAIEFREEALKRLKQKKDTAYTEVVSQIHDDRKKLEVLVKNQIYGARILFATCSKSLVDSVLSDMEFDNIVIDEGSMVAIPYLYALLKRVKKRVIISGDYRQLGPIALASTDMAEKWLKKDLFSLLGKQLHNASCVKMLTYQRRCAPDIINLVNAEFYNNSLKTEWTEKHKKAKKPLIFGSSHVEFLDLGHMEEYKFQFTASQSRINKLSIEAIRSILYKLHK